MQNRFFDYTRNDNGRDERKRKMKRIGLLLMTLILGAGMIGGTAAAESVEVYSSNFGAGTDGWYARGAQSAFRTTEATLKTTGRTANWHSPGHDFEMTPGTLYEMSCEVYQEDMESANFMISIAHSRDGGETYENLAFGNVKKGEWTTLTGVYEAGEFDRYVLYVETTDAPTLSYEIRNFRLVAPNGVNPPKVTEPPMVIEATDNLPSLKELYAGKFDFGAAAPWGAFNDSRQKEMMRSQFSILTPENELKPDSVLGWNMAATKTLARQTGDETAVAVQFDAARPLLTFAQENGIKVHGHVLVWHSQTPEEFFHEGYDKTKPLASREVMLGRLENYIREVLTQTEAMYPGVIVSWDVVNEAIDDGTNWLRTTSPWYKTIGEDFVLRAFEYARKYAADGVLLYYNDYNTAYPNKRAGIVRLLKQLIEEGNIDGYGFQMHHSVGQPSMDMITKSVEDVAALGLKLRVSELDVGTSNTESGFMRQKQMYYDIMKLMLRFSEQTEAVQVWGLTDENSWRQKNLEYPLLFDGKCNPKPAFYGVVEAAE